VLRVLCEPNDRTYVEQIMSVNLMLGSAPQRLNQVILPTLL